MFEVSFVWCSAAAKHTRPLVQDQTNAAVFLPKKMTVIFCGMCGNCRHYVLRVPSAMSNETATLWPATVHDKQAFLLGVFAP